MLPPDLPPQERLTVLHVSRSVDGGLAQVVAGLVRSQVAAGLRVVVAAPPGGTLHAAAATAGAEVVLWPAGGFGSALSGARRLARLIRRTRPHLVHAHGARAGAAVRLAVRGRLPTVYQPHCWPFEAAGALTVRAGEARERRVVRFTHRVLCASEAQRARGAAARLAGRWVVITNGVDLRRFSPGDDDARQELRDSLPALSDAVPAEAPLVVCVARLCPQKGQSTLLRAWPEVTAAVPDARLVLVGDGPDRAALERTAPPGVVFAGAAENTVCWYRAADLVVLPSRWEGMALAPLEAMACGRPVVLSDVGGARECLPPDAADACLVPPDDPAALAGALTTLLADPERRSTLGERLRDHVRMAHDAQRTAGAVLNVYRELLAVPPVLTPARAGR